MHNRSQRRLNAYRGRSRKNVLFQLGEGETPTVRALILYFDGGLFRDEADGEGWISETRTQVALNAGIPYSSAKRGIDRLKAKGILEWDTRKGWRFSYSRWLKMSQAIPIRELPEWDEKTHRADSIPAVATVEPEHEFSEDPRESQRAEQTLATEQAVKVAPPVTSQREAAVTALVAAGCDRSGAWAAVSLAILERRLSLPMIQEITKAVQSIGKAAFRPGALIVAGIKNPALGAKLIRDHQAAHKSPQDRPKSPEHPAMPPKATETRSDGLRRWWKGWEGLLDLSDPDDLVALRRASDAAGWTQAEMQTIPELRQAVNS